MAATPKKPVPGFCPFCGYDNPPQYRFCISCRKRLPDVPRPTAGTSHLLVAPVPDLPSGPAPTPEEGPPARPGVPWILVPVAIIVIVVIALVGAQLLPVYLAGHPSTTTPPPTPGKIVSLCSTANGSNCQGFQFSVPNPFGSVPVNTTSCDPVPSLGPGEVLWMNYSAGTAIYSIVLPAGVFGGADGWMSHAFALVTNQTALRAALWFSHLASGTFTEAISVPAGGGTYCLGWWEPSSSPATVQWLSNLNVTYS